MLDQEWDTPAGTVRVTDFMPPRHHRPRVYRRIEGLRGSVEMAGQLVIRFEYGSQVPWVTQTGNGIRAIAGPDLIEIDSPVPLATGAHAPRDVVRGKGRVSSTTSGCTGRRPSTRKAGTWTAPRLWRKRVAFWRDWSPPHHRSARRVGRPHPAVLDHPEGAHLRAYRGDRRRPDHLAPGGDWRLSKLGLPVLLGPGRQP